MMAECFSIKVKGLLEQDTLMETNGMIPKWASILLQWASTQSHQASILLQWASTQSHQAGVLLQLDKTHMPMGLIRFLSDMVLLPVRLEK